MDNETKSLELIPEEGHPDVGKMVMKYALESIQDKQDHGLYDRWTKNYKLGKNTFVKKDSNLPVVSINLHHKNRLNVVNLLTSKSPAFEIHAVGQNPEEDGSEDKIETMEQTRRDWWRRTEQQMRYRGDVWGGETYGTSFIKMGYNPKAEFGLGEVESHRIDPFYIGHWPVDTTDLQEADIVYHFKPTQVRTLKREHPELAHKIKADSDVLGELNDNRMEDEKEKGLLGTVSGSVLRLLGFANKQGELDDEMTMEVEAWVKDRSTVTKETEEPQQDGTILLKTITTPKYTGNIRVITVSSGGNVVLSDRDNPNINKDLPEEKTQHCWLYSRFPFASAQSIEDGSSLYGQSDIEEHEDIVKSVNKTLIRYDMMLEKASNMIMKNPLTSGVDDAKLQVAKGIIRPKNALEAQAIGYMESMNIPAGIPQSVDMWMNIFYQFSGMLDPQNAQAANGGQLAFKTIAALIERETKTQAGKDQNYSRLLRDKGRMFFSLMQNFYNEERWISTDDKENPQKKVTGTDYLMPLKINVVSGSTMPVSKVQQREEAIEIYKMGAGDPQFLHDKLETEGKEDLLKRMKEGPVGEMMERIVQAMPYIGKQGGEQLHKLLMMDPKEFKKISKKHEVPIIQPQGQEQKGPSPEQQLEMGEKQAGISKVQAEAQKVMAQIEEIKASMAQKIKDSEKAEAEKMLTIEKITTERVKQQQVMAGVELDGRQMALSEKQAEAEISMKRAQVVKELEQAEADIDTKGREVAIKEVQERKSDPYQEKGMKSNNVQN